MNITKESIIGDLVAGDYRTASVFKEKGIDFCCNGNQSIDSACQKEKLNADEVVTALHEIVNQQTGGANIDYNSWPLDLLADYIEKKHHRYVEAKIQEIMPYLQKISRVHGERHPELAEVLEIFSDSAEDLTAHMVKEEKVLFPLIRTMVQAKLNNTKPELSGVQNPIKAMMHEHDTEGERYRRIAALTNNYTLPQDGCNTYRITLSLLKEFEDDLHLHIHLENNILFPKSIKLEEQF